MIFHYDTVKVNMNKQDQHNYYEGQDLDFQQLPKRISINNQQSKVLTQNTVYEYSKVPTRRTKGSKFDNKLKLSTSKFETAMITT